MHNSMKAIAALQADRQSLIKKFMKLDAEKFALADEIEKVNNALEALGAKPVVGAGAKTDAPKKKGIKNPKNASNQKQRHAAIRAILKRPGNDKLSYKQADAIRIKEAKAENK